MNATRRLLQRFGVNRAVSYAMAARIWQIPSGVLTTLLIAVGLEPDQQGVYFLILTVTGMQALADAGLINTILHAVSHEIAHARFDRRHFFHAPKRARQRLSGIMRFAIAWFAVAALLLCIGGSTFGYVMLSRQGLLGTAFAPLLVAIVLGSLTLALAPLVGILEGGSQIQVVNRYRLGQVVTGSVVVWACLLLGAGLWTAAAAVAVQLVWEVVLIAGKYRGFFLQLTRTPSSEFRWRDEIWPLQWRIGVQSIARYLAFFPIYPALFDTQGPAVAGRYGMTWQIFSNLLMVSYVFVRSKAPDFGRLIAEGRRQTSVTLFRQVTHGSTVVLIGLVSAFCIAIAVLNSLPFDLTKQFASRFLTIGQCAAFAFAVIPIHLTQCFSMYIRSQRFDPIWRVNLPTCLTLAVLGYLAAGSGRITTIAIAILVVYSFATIALATMSRWYDRHFRQLDQRENC
ncbi:lipopolysaccharide biosynthesis protein [Roseiconus lacunae]|uniref:Polysaccharide biosynthesis protein n=1 Tax=Roseiconus lacunae TaxID=2605694 RepID=A0ABT7PHV1_9BACT|nr:hypothetical protein [Roseiconus lacunae]MDM4016065.1 hypothetical protein [Roseiconus lacunae]